MVNTVTIVDSTPIVPIAYAASAGQPISAPTIGYNGAGFVAKVVLAGITSVTGTLDATKLSISVTDPGYTNTGGTTTVNRTVLGTGAVIRQFEDPLVNGPACVAFTGVAVPQSSSPNANVLFLITTNGTDLTLYIALNDFIYSGSTINSVTIASGFYTGYTPATPSVTNSSDLAYPAPIFAWHTPDFNSTNGTNTLAVEGVAFHRHAANNKQVACIKYQATDAHSNSGAVSTVSNTTLSTLAHQGNIPEVWAANVDFSTLTQGDVCTINATIYPLLGNNPFSLAASGPSYSNSQRGQRLLKAFNDRTGAYGGALAYCSTTGNDTTGVVSKTASTARALPFLTTDAAVAALKTFNNSINSHNDLGGATLRLMTNAGTWILPDTIDTTITNTWFTIEPDPLATGTITCNGAPGFANAYPGTIKLRNFTYIMNSSSATFCMNGPGGTTSYLCADGINLNVTTGGKTPWNGYFGYFVYNSTSNSQLLLAPDANDAHNYMVLSSTIGTVALNPSFFSTIIGNFLPYDALTPGARCGNNNLTKDYDGWVWYNNRVNSMNFAIGTPGTWANITDYQYGGLTINGGNIYGAIVGGTSASTGGGPTGTGASITDGTVTWAYVSQYIFTLPLGFASVQNMVEIDGATAGVNVYALLNDGDITSVTNGIDMYNTAVGGKLNSVYNDFQGTQIAPAGLIKCVTRRFCVADAPNTKIDGCSGIYHGCYGNLSWVYNVSNFGYVSLFGGVGRACSVVCENLPFGGAGTNVGIQYGGLIWGIPGYSNLLLTEGSAFADDAGYTGAYIMKNFFTNYTGGPWGDTSMFPQWVTVTIYPAFSACQNAGNCYVSTAGGTSGGTAPTHTSGTVSDGGVLWTFAHANFAIGGNYAPIAGTPPTSQVPAGMAGLNFDLAGIARKNDGTGAAGAFEVLGEVSLSPNTAVINTPLTITATGVGTSWTSGTTFSVSGGTGASISGISVNVGAQTATFTLNPGSTTGTLTISDSADSFTGFVTVGLLIVPAPIVIASGTASVVLTETPSGGSGTYTYQWYQSSTSGVKGSAIGGATSSSYTATGLAFGTAYYFTVTVGDSNGDSPVDSVQKEVLISAGGDTVTGGGSGFYTFIS